MYVYVMILRHKGTELMIKLDPLKFGYSEKATKYEKKSST